MGGRVDSVRDETRAIVLLVEGLGGKPVTHGEDDSWVEVNLGARPLPGGEVAIALEVS